MELKRTFRVGEAAGRKPVTVLYDGREIVCPEAEPIGISLYATGIAFLSRSKRLYRPRGMFSLSRQVRNVTLIAKGFRDMTPSEVLARDGVEIMPPPSAPCMMKLLAPLIDIRIHHRRIVKSGILWPRLVGLIKKGLNDPRLDWEHTRKDVNVESEEVDVAVIGGGIAGLSAAISARRNGASVLLIDENQELGGRALYDNSVALGLTKPSKEYVKELISELKRENVGILTNTIFNDFFEDIVIATSTEPDGREAIYMVRAKAYILATGMFDLPCIFENNDLPGIVDISTAMKMLNMYGVLVGRRVAILGFNERSLSLANILRKHGASVFILHNQPRVEKDVGVETLLKVQDLKAIGHECVKGVEVEYEEGKRKLDVDSIVCAARSNADFKLPAQLGARIVYVEELGFVPAHDVRMRVADNAFVAGGVSGSLYGVLHVLEGRIAGLSAASSVKSIDVEGELSEAIKEYRLHMERFGVLAAKEKVFRAFEKFEPPKEAARRPATLFCSSPKRNAFVCFCEDIRLWDVQHAVSKYGTSCIEKIKRLTGVGTGRCQGRLCSVNASLYVAYISDSDPNLVGIPRQRPPLLSIPVYVAASGLIGG